MATRTKAAPVTTQKAAAKSPKAEAKETKNLPALKSNTALADPAAFDGMGTGFENVGASDLLIPRLTILQGLSPQVTQGKPEFDPNAKVGMIYDVGLQEGFPEGVQFLFVHYAKVWIEWFPRNTGKGLAAIHETADILNKCTLNERRQPILPNGNYVQETGQFFGMNMTADRRKSFLPMASTQLKKGRRLLTLAQSEKAERADGSTFNPPLFYRTYSLSSVPESNNEGNWMGWKIERGPALQEFDDWQEILADVRQFREALVRGEARGDLSGVEGDVEHRGSGGDNERM